MSVLHALAAGLLQAASFLWDSVYGLVFGFLISAIVQVALTPGTMHRFMGPNLRGILYAAGFGIISSSCSYGSAAAARGFYQRGADLRSIFSFLISSTNMNVAILVLFWSLLGWKFAFAEFFGGIIIIAVVTVGISLLFTPEERERLAREHPSPAAEHRTLVTECPICGMEGDRAFPVEYGGRTFLACGQKHAADLAADPAHYVDGHDHPSIRPSLRSLQTWREIAATALGDVQMLRTELITGYLIAGFAAALVPTVWLSHALQSVGTVPYFGYVLLLVVGLLIAVVTFVCSMGNVPVARFLATAGIPLGANTAFIYGDLLVPPLIAIYRKSFPPRVTWTFVALFAFGALLAGAVMGATIGNVFGGVSLGSMAFNSGLTLVLNVAAILASLALALAARMGAPTHEPA